MADVLKCKKSLFVAIIQYTVYGSISKQQDQASCLMCYSDRCSLRNVIYIVSAKKHSGWLWVISIRSNSAMHCTIKIYGLWWGFIQTYFE